MWWVIGFVCRSGSLHFCLQWTCSDVCLASWLKKGRCKLLCPSPRDLLWSQAKFRLWQVLGLERAGPLRGGRLLLVRHMPLKCHNVYIPSKHYPWHGHVHFHPELSYKLAMSELGWCRESADIHTATILSWDMSAALLFKKFTRAAWNVASGVERLWTRDSLSGSSALWVELAEKEILIEICSSSLCFPAGNSSTGMTRQQGDCTVKCVQEEGALDFQRGRGIASSVLLMEPLVGHVQFWKLWVIWVKKLQVCGLGDLHWPNQGRRGWEFASPPNGRFCNHLRTARAHQALPRSWLSSCLVGSSSQDIDVKNPPLCIPQM